MTASPDPTQRPPIGSACSVAEQWIGNGNAREPEDWRPEPDASLHDRVAAVFQRVINPELARDGGAVEFVEVDSDRVARIRMRGSCQGCASSAIRLSMILEPTVKKYVPEIKFLEVIP
jgi:Fe-S cluster biogenesis protein NfuA